MPSFASTGTRLQTVSEAADRDSKRPAAAAEYHDRRRDRSYDEDYHEAPRGVHVVAVRRQEDRRDRPAPEDDRVSSRNTSRATPSATMKSPSPQPKDPLEAWGPELLTGQSHGSTCVPNRTGIAWHSASPRRRRNTLHLDADSRSRVRGWIERWNCSFGRASLQLKVGHG